MAKPGERDPITWNTALFDGLRAHKIVLEARQLSKPALINRSGGHKAMHILGSIDAEAWIEIPLRNLLQKRPDKSHGE